VDGVTARALPADDLDHVVRGAGGIWEELRGRRLFITGATGPFGRWMMESLMAADRRFELGTGIVALSRDPASFLRAHPHLAAWPALTWMVGSVTTLSPDAAKGQGFDHVVHLATEGDLAATEADPVAAAELIAGGTLRALEFASSTGAGRFLFSSSGAVYGPQPVGAEFLFEDDALAPLSGNSTDAHAIGGEAKRQAERHCALFAKREGFCPVIARCFTFAGPGLPLDGKFAFGNFMRDALAGRTIVVTGDGTPVRSYLYMADLAIWLWTLLLRGMPGRTYNVGSEQEISLRDLADLIAKELGTPGIDIRQQPSPSQPPSRYVPSTARARTELHLRESIGLAEAIRRTKCWLRH
jgi:nucleoside-diphosphate-sugar epimerase